MDTLQSSFIIKIKLLQLLIFLALPCYFSSASAVRDSINPKQPLLDGEVLVSSGGNFALGFFTPSNSSNRYVGIWYNNITVQTIVWVAKRDYPLNNISGANNNKLSVSENGRLSITSNNSTSILTPPVASSRTAGLFVAQLLDSGNLVINDMSAGRVVWQSFDYPTDTLLPGMKLGVVDPAAGLYSNLTAWSKPNDPSPGAFSVLLQSTGAPQLVLRNKSTPIWASGPWIGSQFSGWYVALIPAFNFTMADNDNEVFLTFQLKYKSSFYRMVVMPTGNLELSAWLQEAGDWAVFWSAPWNECDTAACGPNSFCEYEASPSCSCLPGFTPKSASDMGGGDYSAGCVRRNAKDCDDSSSDSFVVLSNTMLPDTNGLTRDKILSLAECQAICLANCSCNAFASAELHEGSGSGCMIWTSDLTGIRVVGSRGGRLGLDLHVRISIATEFASRHFHKKKKLELQTTIGVVSGIMLLLLVTCFICKIIKRRKEHEDLDLPVMHLKTLIAATNNFSADNKLGEGGFGQVYKGKLEDGQEIAVKRLSKTSIQGVNELITEVTLIAKLQHRNLVRLLGCCIQGEEKMLVYEYMPNKSLDFYIFDKTQGSLLEWESWYQIILGIARGLLYLHQDSRFRIVHRDLKAENILLDKDMNPKISDFGMARILGGEQSQASTRRVMGTYGYMSPEYMKDGIFSIKSDIFSFGVLLLEILTGKRNRSAYFQEPHHNLLGYTWNLWRNGNGVDVIDESISDTFATEKALRCINIGLLCVQEHPEDRPTMSVVVLMLGSEDMAIPYPKRPGFAISSSNSEPSTELDTVNDVTVSMLVGR